MSQVLGKVWKPLFQGFFLPRVSTCCFQELGEEVGVKVWKLVVVVWL